jgi:serine phosphatase RsbU (regulator of sigma subunit)
LRNKITQYSGDTKEIPLNLAVLYKLKVIKMKIFFLFFLLTSFSIFSPKTVFTQGLLDSEKKSIDSIRIKIKSEKNTKERDTFFLCLDKLYEKINNRLRNSGDLKNTEKYVREAMDVALEGKHYNTFRSLHNNLGLILKETGRNKEAIKYYMKGLKLKYENENPATTGVFLNNLGSLYYDDEQYELAFKYFYKAADYRAKNGDPYAADAYWNISFAYLKKGDTTNYIANLKIAAKMYKAMENEYGDASFFFTTAAIAQLNKEYEKANRNFLLSATGYKKLGFLEYVAWSYFGVARAKWALGEYALSEKYADSSLSLAKQIESKERTKVAAEFLSKIHLKNRNYEKAYYAFELFIQTRDSIQNINNSKALIRSEYKYDYEIKSKADSIERAKEKEISIAKIAQQEAEISAKRNQQFFLFGGLALVLIFAIFMYNRFKVTQRQKNVIEEQKNKVEEQNVLIQHQKHEVEEKNKEITDSINYAKRIQEAILPSRYSLVENLKNGFVLYKPKDIVAGDFYWLEKYDNKVFFAAADCTGHGVPGAMVSVVCSNAISKALLEDGITETGKILDRTRELVIEKFSKSGENVKDGMDISLVKFEVENNEIVNLEWSGANNPLWLIRKGELLETKPDKQPIGNYAEAKPFTTHFIEIQKGDTLYVFTDGYEDQFGGEKGKKFKSAKMKELFLSIQEFGMDDQKDRINKAFENWRGELEQVDDVCVIGVRI